MKRLFKAINRARYGVLGLLLGSAVGVQAADKELLDILLGNGAITQGQHEYLMKRGELTAEDFGAAPKTAAVEEMVDQKVEAAVSRKLDERIDTQVDESVTEKVASAIEDNFPVKASYGSKGFRLETRDSNWQTNLQWRAQLRFTNPTNGDPRQLGNFGADAENTFEARRLRMKIGGHGYRPWLGYYFEVDLQPARDVDDDSESASARVIDWRITADKWDWLGAARGSVENRLQP